MFSLQGETFCSCEDGWTGCNLESSADRVRCVWSEERDGERECSIKHAAILETGEWCMMRGGCG